MSIYVKGVFSKQVCSFKSTNAISKATGVYRGTGLSYIAMNASRFIACGMYAPNDDIKSAWQAIFDEFYALVGPLDGLDPRLVFGTDESLLRDPGLLIGQTCGYPLMTGLQDAVMPFCTACFDLPGANGKLYSSVFIVPADSSLESLRQCRGGIVAVNNANSNSGMNVLRYALAKLKAGPGFFSNVLMTGGHLASLEAVAANRAQLAAIDCVSYQLLTAQNTGLDRAIRIIGFSEQTCGLPLVVARAQYSRQQCTRYLEALNQALRQTADEFRQTLYLDHFESVELDDYRSILALENYAIEAGYATLN